MIKEVLSAYGLNINAPVKQFGHGLINDTWKINDETRSYILQKINTAVFKHPELIAENIEAVSGYLKVNHPGYFFCRPCKTTSGENLFYLKDEGCFRLFPFVENSHTIDVAKNTSQAYEAAKNFSRLTKLLSVFPIETLKITLPDFHNLSLRYKDFITATQSGNQRRIKQSLTLIKFLQSQKNIADEYEKIIASPAFKVRVTHHDTKINNVLFDNDDKGICIIDLDTMMPGYFISDVGDMIRTYISPVNEDEADFSRIEMREDYFIAIAKGYLDEMLDELSQTELEHFVYAGKFMIYMQALRFLKDYLNNDIYYGSKYEGHNFIRAGNQAHLLKLLIEKEKRFQAIVYKVVQTKSKII